MFDQAAFDQAVELGRAVTGDPGSLYDEGRIAAHAEALGIRASFSPDFPDNGQVLVHSPIPQAGACLYLPSSAGWAFDAGHGPCEGAEPRGGPQAIPVDGRPGMGIVGPESWADPDNPLSYDTAEARAIGYGEVYVHHIGGGEGVAVTVDGHLRVDGQPGTEAYVETAAQVPCRDGSSDWIVPGSRRSAVGARLVGTVHRHSRVDRPPRRHHGTTGRRAAVLGAARLR